MYEKRDYPPAYAGEYQTPDAVDRIGDRGILDRSHHRSGEAVKRRHIGALLVTQAMIGLAFNVPFSGFVLAVGLLVVIW